LLAVSQASFATLAESIGKNTVRADHHLPTVFFFIAILRLLIEPSEEPSNGADHGAEHELQHRLFGKRIGNDVEAPALFYGRSKNSGRPGCSTARHRHSPACDAGLEVFLETSDGAGQRRLIVPRPKRSRPIPDLVIDAAFFSIV
jgi:hypothetical protein